ncbi:MAG: AAA family ATPase [Deltaproteobacteria bacterium]|nr:AAA family ATPase [Deltaproteobacteria bacterium]
MYTEFYNIKEKPFNLSPSSRFLYLGEIHKEALAFLTYGVVERKGFILLTGEVGTGKTTMIQALLANIDDDVEYVYLSNPLFSINDFMDYLAFSVFKKKLRFRSKSDFLIQFEEYLKDRLRQQKIFVLLIDEAQKLSYELLEEVRLLSNMETADEKLINIFLVGQPELNGILSQPRCRPLLQRISIRYHLKPLDLDGAREYIMTRLKIAGAGKDQKIFSKGAIKAIHKYSEGYPRVINILADNALLLGYSRGKRELSPEMIKECYEDLQLEASFLKSGLKKEPEPDELISTKHSVVNRYWIWAIVILLVIFLLSFYLSRHSRDFSFWFFNEQKYNTAETQGVQDQQKEPNIEGQRYEDATSDSALLIDQEIIPITPLEEEAESQVKAEKPAHQSDERQSVTTSDDSMPKKDEQEWKEIILVKEGDTITGLTAMVYGVVNEEILDLIKQSNPEINNINFIDVGQKVYFPKRSTSKPNVMETYTVHIASFIPLDHAQELFQKLISQGYEAYMIPINDAQKGKIFRITLGNFQKWQDAQDYAALILQKGISEYAKTIQLEMR